jgi:tripeptidyl-peptidase-1
MRNHTLSVLCILTTRFLSSLAAPRWEDVQVKHKWDNAPENWTNLGHPSADTTIDIHIALKPQNENALIDALYEVSSPDHPKYVLSPTLLGTPYPHVTLPHGRYGDHLSMEQVTDLVAPPPDDLELVNAWLDHHGVLPSTISKKQGGSWLTLIGVPVPHANDLLGASYRLYQHTGTNETIVRTLSYSLPRSLLSYVQTVIPTTYFNSPRTSWQNPRVCRGGAATQEKVPTRETGTMLSIREDVIPPVTPAFLRFYTGHMPMYPLWQDTTCSVLWDLSMITRTLST